MTEVGVNTDQVPSRASAIPVSTSPPLRELFRYAGGHRSRMIIASVLSSANKICDIAPELLIGAAVDVTVQLRDAAGKTQQLRARAQPIRRLD